MVERCHCGTDGILGRRLCQSQLLEQCEERDFRWSILTSSYFLQGFCSPPKEYTADEKFSLEIDWNSSQMPRQGINVLRALPQIYAWKHCGSSKMLTTKTLWDSTMLMLSSSYLQDNTGMAYPGPVPALLQREWVLGDLSGKPTELRLPWRHQPVPAPHPLHHWGQQQLCHVQPCQHLSLRLMQQGL